MAETLAGRLTAILGMDAAPFAKGVAQAVRETDKLKRGSNRLGTNLRSLSQGFSDFTISLGTGGLAGGLRGASNNLEVMAMSLGGIAGPAAAAGVTLAAVFAPKLIEHIRSANTELMKFTQSMKDLKAAREDATKSLLAGFRADTASAILERAAETKKKADSLFAQRDDARTAIPQLSSQLGAARTKLAGLRSIPQPARGGGGAFGAGAVQQAEAEVGKLSRQLSSRQRQLDDSEDKLSKIGTRAFETLAANLRDFSAQAKPAVKGFVADVAEGFRKANRQFDKEDKQRKSGATSLQQRQQSLRDQVRLFGASGSDRASESIRQQSQRLLKDVQSAFGKDSEEARQLTEEIGRETISALQRIENQLRNQGVRRATF